MAAVKRLKRDLPIRTCPEAIELLWAERARVKMTPNVHLELSRRIRSSVAALNGPQTIKTWNPSVFGTYVPWAKALGLWLVFIDGDVQQPIDGLDGFIGFIEGALERRDITMAEHIRRCQTAKLPGGRAVKEMKMGNAIDIHLTSLWTHKTQLGFELVLRAA